ncbi:LAMI_0E14994g1_1 [Lachancea mirantina]|uniref:LAMI_0E14994g1_1 n=1 Tax=Lachancea mirantina TaxID=1230905 RepID=A0A1G4JS29_9SACH|nr:LAMI_0E14994g1_1 [Lachancea mirantina]
MHHIVPQDTIARVLETCSFESEDTRITESTVNLVDKYLEMFVREAVLRSLENKEQEVKQEENNPLREATVLTHKDLERVLGVLLLDM